MKNTEVMFTKEEIRAKVEELGRQITSDYKGKKLMVIALLKGSFIFAADLVREIKTPAVIEFMTTSSYADGTTSSGKVNIVQDITRDLSDFHILVVDDITDTAHTMAEVVNHLKTKNPLSIKSCVLLDKPSRRAVEYTADYIGFTVPDLFIVGYGLNYGDLYRNEDYIFALIE